MRITGGKARGISLKAPKDQKTRPATDRMRESLFSSLSTSIIDATCLDLFAGTGSYGFEALSRGAQFCQFIEHNRTAIDCLRQNAQAIKKCARLRTEAIHIKQADLLKVNTHSYQQSFDFIFLDPPYDFWETHPNYLLNKVALGYANENTKLILECPSELKLSGISSHWILKKRLGKKGKTKPNILIFKRINSAS